MTDCIYLLLPHILGFHADDYFVAGAVGIYALPAAVTAILLRSRSGTPTVVPVDQRHFVYLHRDRIHEALEGIGESISDTTFTRTRTVEGNLTLTLPRLPVGGLRRQTEDQITRTVQQGGRAGYRLLEKYLDIRQLPDLERMTIADTIWSVPVETSYVKPNPQENETYLLGHVPHLNTDVWVRLDDKFCDERPIGSPGTRFDVVGWVQWEQCPIAGSPPSIHPPAVRLRPMAIRLMA